MNGRSALLLALVAALSGSSFLSSDAPAQTAGAVKECEEIRGGLKTMNDQLGELLTENEQLTQRVNEIDEQIKKFDRRFADLTKGAPFWSEEDIRTHWLEAKRRFVVLRSKYRTEIEDNKATIQVIRDLIAADLNKLGDCGKKKTENSPTPKPSVSPSPTVTSGGTPTISASSINCDCANTEAPNIGGAAVRQCLRAEGILKAKATAGELKLEVVDGKIVRGDVCDTVTAGPAAWPVNGKPAQP